MSMYKNVIVSMVVAAVALATSNVQAAPLYSDPGGAPRDNFGMTVGFDFTSTSDLLVTQLGYFDDDHDGNVSSHAVGLWLGSTLLGSVTVQAGTASSLTEDYRYEALTTPITLTAGVEYRLGARVENASGDVWPDLTASFTLNLPVTVHARYDLSAGLNSPGTVASGAGVMYQAPNLLATVVPEPNSLILIVLGSTGMLRFGRRRR